MYEYVQRFQIKEITTTTKLNLDSKLRWCAKTHDLSISFFINLQIIYCIGKPKHFLQVFHREILHSTHSPKPLEKHNEKKVGVSIVDLNKMKPHFSFNIKYFENPLKSGLVLFCILNNRLNQKRLHKMEDMYYNLVTQREINEFSKYIYVDMKLIENKNRRRFKSAQMNKIKQTISMHFFISLRNLNETRFCPAISRTAPNKLLEETMKIINKDGR